MVLSPSFLSGTMLGPGGTVDSKLDTVLVFMQPSVQGAEKNHSTIIKIPKSLFLIFPSCFPRPKMKTEVLCLQANEMNYKTKKIIGKSYL